MSWEAGADTFTLSCNCRLKKMHSVRHVSSIMLGAEWGLQPETAPQVAEKLLQRGVGRVSVCGFGGGGVPVIQHLLILQEASCQSRSC